MFMNDFIYSQVFTRSIIRSKVILICFLPIASLILLIFSYSPLKFLKVLFIFVSFFLHHHFLSQLLTICFALFFSFLILCCEYYCWYTSVISSLFKLYNCVLLFGLYDNYVIMSCSLFVLGFRNFLLFIDDCFLVLCIVWFCRQFLLRYFLCGEQ